MSQRGTGGPFEGLEQQEGGSSLSLSHQMLLLANSSREREILPTSDMCAGICSACRWVKGGECCFLATLMVFPDKWVCSCRPSACESRALSHFWTLWLCPWDWGNPSALWPLPHCPAHRGAAVLQEHSCLQQDSLGSPSLPDPIAAGAVTPPPPGTSSTKPFLCRGSETLPVLGSSQPLSSQSHCVLCCHSSSFPARQGDPARPDGSDTRGPGVTQTFHCRGLGKSTQRTWLQGQGDSGVCASASKIPILF